jgi:beta-glucosidase
MTHNSQEQGNGLADVLFGRYNPAGRLTQTWVKEMSDLPAMMDYNIRDGRTYMYAKQKPLYAFGFGLSYTTFEYSNMRLGATQIQPRETVNVSVDVKNTGTREGDEVVQMYVAHQGSAVARAKMELRGFRRVHLKVGETATVTMPLPARALTYWDEKTSTFVLEADKVRVMVGGSSDKLPLDASLQVVR